MNEPINIKVNSVGEFVDFISNMDFEHFYNDVAHHLALYRGHADIEWILYPSVYRTDDDFMNERFYIKEACRTFPHEFDTMDNFDKLVKMQHYGIPTRILDFTFNPLVALFFACSEKHDKDGIVYLVDAAIYYKDEPPVKRIVEYLFREINDIDSRDFIYYIAPDYSNARVRSQQGAFALFNFESSGGSQRRYKIPSEGMEKSVPPKYKFLIPAAKKEQFLVTLDRIGINTSFLFPELTYSAKHIVDTIRRDNKGINKRINPNMRR